MPKVKVFFVQEVRNMFNSYYKEEISLSRLTEMLNEKATGLSAIEMYKIEMNETPAAPVGIKSAEVIKENARQYAESKMIYNWDRQDHIMIGIFYHHFVDYIFNQNPVSEGIQEATSEAIRLAFEKGYSLGYQGGELGEYYYNNCWETYKSNLQISTSYPEQIFETKVITIKLEELNDISYTFSDSFYAWLKRNKIKVEFPKNKITEKYDKWVITIDTLEKLFKFSNKYLIPLMLLSKKVQVEAGNVKK